MPELKREDAGGGALPWASRFPSRIDQRRPTLIALRPSPRVKQRGFVPSQYYNEDELQADSHRGIYRDNYSDSYSCSGHVDGPIHGVASPLGQLAHLYRERERLDTAIEELQTIAMDRDSRSRR